MAKFSNIIRESNENQLISKLIELFRSKLDKKIKLSKRFSFVLTGGNSPIKLYKKLCKIKKIQWNKVDFFIGDERYVNENSKNSNINLCNKYLLEKLKIPKKQIYSIPTSSKSIFKDTKFYENKINKYFNNKIAKFDLVLLGMGNDGHIASLFKNNIDIKNNKNVCFVKKKDYNRISLTIKSINNSKTIFLWAPGKNKKKIVKEICADHTKKYAVSFLRKKNNFLFYGD